MRIPLNYNSGEAVYFGLSTKKWILSIVPGVILGFLLNMILSLFGINAAIGSLAGFGVGFIIDIIFILKSYTGENPLDSSKDFFMFVSGRRKLEYRYIKKHRRSKADLNEIIRSQNAPAEEDAELTKSDSAKPNLESALSGIRQLTQARSKLKKVYYTQQECPVKDVEKIQGKYFIRLKSGELVRVIEIDSISFFTEPDLTKQVIMEGFLNFLKYTECDLVQIKVKAQPPDMSAYNRKLLDKTSREQNDLVRRLGEDIAQFLDEKARDLKVNRYFIIATAKDKDAFEKLTDFEIKVNRYIAKKGIVIKTHKDEERFLDELLYEHYNHPEISSYIAPYEVRKEKVEYLTRNAGYNKKPKEHNLVSPLGMDFTTPDCVYSSGMYHQTCFITDLPRDMYVGWLFNFVNAISPYHEIDMHIQRVKKTDSLKLKVDTKISNYMGTHPRGQNQKLYETLNDANYIKDTLPISDFYYFTLAITIHAEDPDTLKDLVKLLSEYVSEKIPNAKINKAHYLQEGAYKMVAPICMLDKTCFDRFKRNSMDEGVSTLLPFLTTSSIPDEGVCFGMNKRDGSPVIIDLFKPKTAHTLVVGGTGNGKSFSTMMQATRCRIDGAQVIVLCPTKGHEYKFIADQIGGSYIPLGPGYDTTINVFAIIPQVKADYDESDRFEVKSLLDVKISELQTFFRIAFPYMTPAHENQLSTTLYKLYKKFGITENNASIFDEDGNLKPMPLMEDFQKLMMEDPILSDIAPQLNEFVTGSMKFFNAPTNRELNNGFIVLDLTGALNDSDDSESSRRRMALLVNLATSLIRQRVKSNTTIRKVLIFEEAWKFMSEDSIMSIIDEFYRTARSYNCSCYCVSQGMRDFADKNGLIDNAQNFIIFSGEAEDAKKSVEVLSALTKEDEFLIPQLGLGDAIIVRGGKRIQTHFEACGAEEWLYETNPEKRKQRYQQQMGIEM